MCVQTVYYAIESVYGSVSCLATAAGSNSPHFPSK